MIHYCALYTVEADIEHNMSVMKTSLFLSLVVYRFSVLLFLL